MSVMRRWLPGLFLLAGVTPAAAAVSPQEALLRAKPAVTLVIVEVGSEVTLTCPGGREQTVTPAPFRETSSGWFVDPSGWLVTNAHVVQHHASPPAILSDGRILPTRLLATDTDHDLAALSVAASGLPTIELGAPEPLQPGQWVLALGHPWGVAGAATAGVIIGVGPPPEMPQFRGELIQVGVHLRPGHSGGPLVDVQSRVVGIHTMMAGPDVGLAVPLHVVKTFLHRLPGNP